MNQRSLFGPARRERPALSGQPDTAPENETPAGQTRAEALQRLQVGLFGIGSMVLLVGLASIIGSQADLTDEAAVPEAAPTTEPKPAASQANPLADAGVVPDIAANPGPSPSPTPLDLPPPPRAQGSGNAASQQ
ncbi:MAG TPA: hypothetical protein VK913_09290 [Erythrobacter sp.]|nr:hypothetical protein [Erythrobacter sp.]